MTSITWTFRGVDGVNVQCPRALDAGVARIIGKRHDAESGDYLPDEPTRYVLPKREAASLRSFFAKAMRHGALAPADRLTAEAFGIPLTAAPTAAGVTDG